MNDFIFLANWYDIIKAYDDAGQTDVASAIAKEIIIYGVTGDTKTTDPLIGGLVKGLCAAQISKPKAKGGRPKKINLDDADILKNSGMSHQEIADNLGCSIKTVRRALTDADIDDEI